MGRKTFESLPNTLPGRRLIVITQNPHYKAAGCLVTHHLTEALAIAEQAGENEVFIAGGGAIYQAALPFIDQVYLTIIKANVPGDTFFPLLASHEWIEVERICHEPDQQHAYAYDFVKLLRRK